MRSKGYSTWSVCQSVCLSVSLSICLRSFSNYRLRDSSWALWMIKAQQGLKNMWQTLLKVLCSRVIAWKPSEQSLGSGSARFVLSGCYTKGDLRDLLRLCTGPLPAYLTAMHCLRLWLCTYKMYLAVCTCTFCEWSTYARAVFSMHAASMLY